MIRVGDDRFFIFKSNVLRFRKGKDKNNEGNVFLQFVQKGNNRISFILGPESWNMFCADLPHPGEVQAVSVFENAGVSEIQRTC